MDTRQNLKWGMTYFDSSSRLRLSDNEGQRRFVFVKPLYELRPNSPSSPEEAAPFKGAALSLYSTRDGKSRMLLGTTWDDFGFDISSESFGWKFQASQISPDESEFWIVGGNEILTWKTQNGQLLRRVRLTDPKKSIQSAAISPDCRSVVTRYLVSSSEDEAQAVVFDARTGKKRFSLPKNAAYGFGFSPSSEILWAADGQDYDNTNYSFYDAQSGRLLWSCRKGSAMPAFSASKKWVLLEGAKGLEVRDYRSGKLVRSIAGPLSSSNQIAISPDGSQAWTSQSDGQIWSWRIR